eukprot:TRINITY_DN2803_c0_g1_i1.p1 TRINITY_DN2803_c0_g1~~TRINITY_DN2803_c0_g1_i1.p1  ORF type:complete len:313 (+),score=77.59 TRINITY_DN2803_c0_g1_i1:305-1243(+)
MASLDGFDEVHALAFMLEDMNTTVVNLPDHRMRNETSPRNRPLNNTNNSNSTANNNVNNDNNNINPNISQEMITRSSNNISFPLASEPIPIPSSRSQQGRAGRQRMRSESIDLEAIPNNETGRETEEENNCANFLENSPRISSPMQPSTTPPTSPPQAPLDISELECSLCFRLFYQPVTTACGHSFCKPCLFSALKYSVNCPLCRYRIVNKSSEAGDRYSVNIIINNLVEKYFPEEYHARLEEEELWKLEKKKRAKEERMMQDDESVVNSESNGNNVSSPSNALSSPSNTWYQMIVPSVRGTCQVLLSCGGF